MDALGTQWYYRRVEDPTQELGLERLHSGSCWCLRYGSNGPSMFADWRVVAPNSDGHVQVRALEDFTLERVSP